MFFQQVNGLTDRVCFHILMPRQSDLYVIPRFRTAFVNPFTEQPTLDILCSFYTKDGLPLESAPEYILKRLQKYLLKKPVISSKQWVNWNIISSVRRRIYTLQRTSEDTILLPRLPIGNVCAWRHYKSLPSVVEKLNMVIRKWEILQRNPDV